MTTLILDFSSCKYIGELHARIKETFGFPEYYGENLDALWDLLDNYDDCPINVHIRGFNSLPNELYEYKMRLYRVFIRVSHTTPNISFAIES